LPDSWSNSWVMPSLVPTMPLSENWAMGLELDLDVDAGGQVEPHQRVDGLGRRLMDVDQPLVRADLEMLPGVLVLERSPDHAVDVLLRGEGHRARHRGAGPLCGLHDRTGRQIDLRVVVALEAYADLLCCHVSVSPFDYSLVRRGSWLRRRHRRC